MSKEAPYILKSKINIPYQWQSGNQLAKFFAGLKEGILLASRCESCGYKSVPPRGVCPRCFEKIEKFEKITNRGTLTAITRLNLDGIKKALGQKIFRDYLILIEQFAQVTVGADGKIDQLPNLQWGLVKFDSCQGSFLHLINPACSLSHLKLGMAMKAVFKEKDERNESILDILYFDLLGGH